MPTQPTPIVRAYRAKVDDVMPSERSLVARINTGCVDRYNTVIEPRGIKLDDYKKNPVVLWEHGRDPMRGAMPIGECRSIGLAIGPDGPELLAKTRFLDDEFSSRLYECYKDGVLRGFSVNIVPDMERSSPPTHDEIRDRPHLKSVCMMYRGGDLAEYSAVAVPGNAQALTVDEARSVLALVSRGLTLPAELIQRAKDMDDDDESESEERKKEKPTHGVKYEDGKYKVVANDGKPMGEYDTREEADKRVQEIEYFKHHGKSAPAPSPSPTVELPPLSGRSYEEYRADLLAQARGLFDPAAITAEVRMHRDWHSGKV